METVRPTIPCSGVLPASSLATSSSASVLHHENGSPASTIVRVRQPQVQQTPGLALPAGTNGQESAR